MKKTLFIGLALGLISATAAYAVDQRPDAVKNGALPTQGCDAGWDCASQKNWGGAGIIGSSHDMTNVGGTVAGLPHNSGASATEQGTATGANAQYTDAQKRICVYCHHPHNAVIAAGQEGAGANAPSYSPLWNRLASAAAGRTYQGYNNGIMMAGSDASTASDKRHALNAAVEGGGTAIAGVSLLCMSCHDGVTAMSAYSQANPGGATGSNDNGQAGTPADSNNISPDATSSFEGNMNNHHPMGFKYAAVQAVDAEIAPITTIMVPATGVDIKGLLYGNGANATMECVTCHDVHNTANQPGAERFLWRSDNNSNFCLTCHLK